MKRALRLNVKEREAQEKLAYMLRHGAREADAEFRALTEKAGWAEFVKAQLSSELDEADQGSGTRRSADVLQTKLEAVEKARSELVNGVRETEKRALKRALEVQEITAELTHKPKALEELASKAERRVTEGRLLEVLSSLKTKMVDLERVAVDAQAVAEFRALTEKTAWADIVKAQLSSELSAFSEMGTWDRLLAEPDSRKEKATALHTKLAAVEAAHTELANAVIETERRALKRALELEAVKPELAHKPAAIEDLTSQPERPAGRLLEVLSLAKTKMDGLEQVAVDAQAASESTEELIETMAGARQAIAEETKQAPVMPMVGAVAAVILAVSAYSLVMLPKTVAAAPPRPHEFGEVWDECQLGEPNCIEIEVDV